jgi:hypothetical protein
MRRRTDPLGVVAGDDQHLGGNVGVELEGGHHVGHQFDGELIQDLLVSLISASRASQRRAMAHSACLAAAVMSVIGPGRSAEQRRIKPILVNGSSCSRSSPGALSYQLPRPAAR